MNSSITSNHLVVVRSLFESAGDDLGISQTPGERVIRICSHRSSEPDHPISNDSTQWQLKFFEQFQFFSLVHTANENCSQTAPTPPNVPRTSTTTTSVSSASPARRRRVMTSRESRRTVLRSVCRLSLTIDARTQRVPVSLYHDTGQY